MEKEPIIAPQANRRVIWDSPPKSIIASALRTQPKPQLFAPSVPVTQDIFQTTREPFFSIRHQQQRKLIPIHEEKLSKPSTCISSSPFLTSPAVLAYGTSSSVVVLKTDMENARALEERGLEPCTTLTPVTELQLSSRAAHICWSPASASPTIENPTQQTKVCMAVSTGARTIRYFTHTEKATTDVELGSHDSYINATAFSPDGSLLLSVGDDKRVILWDVASQSEIAIYGTKSPGMSCDFNYQLPNLFMCAELSGTITVRDVRERNPVAMLRASRTPLIEAHWNKREASLMGAVSGTHWYIWRLRGGKQEQINGIVHGVDGVAAKSFQWSNFGDSFAVACDKESSVWDYATGGCERMNHNRGLTGLTWLAHNDVLVTATPHEAKFWKVTKRNRL